MPTQAHLDTVFTDTGPFVCSINTVVEDLPVTSITGVLI